MLDGNQCVDTYDRYSVGFGSPVISIEIQTGIYFQCWRDTAADAKVFAPVSLENLENQANWVVCEEPGNVAALTPLPPCQREDCQRKSATLCTFEDTCTEMACGDHESAFRQDGCERQKGSPKWRRCNAN